MGQGLSQSSIQAIAQCDDGFLWFGTQVGLDRYDGYGFRSWRHEPRNPESLSHSMVMDLLASRSGHLWVATARGLNRFDTRTGVAERFYWPDLDQQGLAWAETDLSIYAESEDGALYLGLEGRVARWQPATGRIETLPYLQLFDVSQGSERSAVLDLQGRFWLLNSAGLWRLDEERGGMVRVRPLTSQPALPFYSALGLTREGKLALVDDHTFKLIDPDTLHVERRIAVAEFGRSGARFNAAMPASDGSVWLATSTSLVRYHPLDDEWQLMFDQPARYSAESGRRQLQMVEHPDGDLWLASQFGVARWHAGAGRLQIFRHDPQDPSSLPPSTPGAGYTVFIDSLGTVWVGSRTGGLGRYTGLAARFEHIRALGTQEDLPYAGLNVVLDVVEQAIDERHDLWLVLDHGGVRRLTRQSDGAHEWVSSFHQAAEADRRLPSDAVIALAVDPHSDLIWALERQNLIGIDSQTDRVVASVPVNPDLPGLSAGSLTLSPDGSALWVGTSAGVYEFHPGQDRTRLGANPLNPFLPELRVNSLLALDEHLVLAAGNGFGVVDFSDLAKSESFLDQIDDVIHGLAHHDEDGWWFGTRTSGLAHVRLVEGSADAVRPEIEWYDQAAGLADKTIYAILPDDDGWLWMSSSRGLMQWNPQTRQMRHFTPADGIQSFEFNAAAASIGPSGRFYFGGINGVNAFLPGAIAWQPDPPRIHLQELNIGGEPVEVNPGIEASLALSHDQNDLHIEYVGLHSGSAGRIRYAFWMEGLDRDWVDAGDSRQVRYPGLLPGQYRFYVRAANSDGVWSEEALLLSAVIHPPPWKSGWAYLAYVILVLALGALVYGVNLHRRKALETEVRLRTAELVDQQAIVQRQAIELKKALEARTLFFANISHEFRTPLTLIEASLARLRADGGDVTSVERGRRYLRRLLRLVDQLLDLSRLNSTLDTFDGPPWALAPVVGSTVDAFQALAEQNGVELEADIESGWSTYCNQEQVEKVLLNLISNAVKFSPSGSEVNVSLVGHGDEVIVEVADNGPGIPPKDHALIFRRFYRSEGPSAGVSGTGIGLALVHEAITAMGGRIELNSEPGRGSQFKVYLPAWREGIESVPAPGDGIEAALLEPAANYETGAGAGQAQVQRGCVLVVDNNAEMRQHLREVLSAQWRVLEAEGGEAALGVARADAPDVIISDLMMPGMDGFELLAAIREDIETSHIPLLMLTARQDRDTRLKGLSLSVDDFLPKPFDPRELLLRLGRIMDNRDRLRRRLSGDSINDEIGGRDAFVGQDLSQRDRKLLDAVNASLAKYAQDPEFTVELLAESVLVERRTLQRKLKALTGRSPAKFIRQHRFSLARKLMLETDHSVTEIAFTSGFASAQHFSRAFRNAYGMPPDKWRQAQKVAIKS